MAGLSGTLADQQAGLDLGLDLHWMSPRVSGSGALGALARRQDAGLDLGLDLHGRSPHGHWRGKVEIPARILVLIFM